MNPDFNTVKTLHKTFLFLLLLIFSLSSCATDESDEETTTSEFTALASWGQHIGRDSSGNTYIAGVAYGDISNDTGAGEADVFLAKIRKDSTGDLLWITRVDSPGDDLIQDMFITSNDEIFLAGYTKGTLEAGAKAGGTDIFLMRFDTSGDRNLTKQIGTDKNDFCWSITMDASDNIYLAGSTEGSILGSGKTNQHGYDFFVSRLDTSYDTAVWTHQTGTDNLIGDSPYLYSQSFAVDLAFDGSGDLWVSGYTNDSLASSSVGGEDLFLAKYKADGTQDSIWQFGSPSDDMPKDLAVSSTGDIYLTGYSDSTITDATRDDTSYSLSSTHNEVFIYKFKSDSTGDPDWIKQTGTEMNDWGNGLAIDSLNNLYLIGNTDGDITGDVIGNTDFFIRKYDASGDLLWSTQNGSTAFDSIDAVVMDASDNIYVTGRTFGTLDGKTNSQQAFEAFVSQYSDATSDPAWTMIIGED